MSEQDNVATVQERVARFFGALTPNGFVTLPNGLMSAHVGSTSVYVGVGPFGAGLTQVSISAPVLIGVAPTWELYRFVALNGSRYPFGRIHVRWSDVPDHVDLLYQHSLLGDYLDQEEFNLAISIVGQAADELDDEMQREFGGSRGADIGQ